MQRATFLTLISSLVVPMTTMYAKELTLEQQYRGTTEKQKELIRKLYNAGKPYGLSKTLVVIAWRESSFGIELENKQGEGSGGPLGLSYLHTVMREFKVLLKEDVTGLMLWRVQEMIKHDLDFSIKHAVIHLQRGIKKFGKDWMKVWAFYNGGYKYWDSQDAKRYAEDFRKKIKVINKVGIL